VNTSSKIYIALPVLNESLNLAKLTDCLQQQYHKDFKLFVCVNNYDKWWDDAVKMHLCFDNQASIKYLKQVQDLDIHLIDRSSKNKGWQGKKGGVGWARKTAMDLIAEQANTNDIIVSMDADTYYPENYLSTILEKFERKDGAHGLAVPYYHRLAGDETDKLILRYEIYMRYYFLNMIRIGNPYAFTALGSAMAFPVWAYKKVGGLTPVMSGEDFYFLQKLSKTGRIGLWCDAIAYPSPRFSDRVLFGTGPAIIKGNTGNWDSYPLYSYRSFDKVGNTFTEFPRLYDKDLPTPMDDFLRSQFKSNDLWSALRKNYNDRENFVKACINKVDGLRILQFLRSEHKHFSEADERYLSEWIEECGHEESALLAPLSGKLDFSNATVKEFENIRDYLFKIENTSRIQHDH
jgi:glycosyltransferase involved in cell wall biosynthesis